MVPALELATRDTGRRRGVELTSVQAAAIVEAILLELEAPNLHMQAIGRHAMSDEQSVASIFAAMIRAARDS
jgi:hypothetical protein